MKKLLLLLALFSFSALFAASISPDGNIVTIENIAWQPIKYEDSDVGFTALMPGGSATYGTDTEWNIYANTTYQGVEYSIACRLASRYSPPPTADLFLSQVRDMYKATYEGKDIHVESVSVNQRKVKYSVDVTLENFKARVYCSGNQIYFASVEGSDFSLAPAFFDSVKITKSPSSWWW